MRVSDVMALALESLRLHRLRTSMTVVAVAIGVIAVLVLTALGDATKQYVIQRFAAMGSNVVTITPGRLETSGIMGAGTGGTRDLTIEDAEAVRLRVPGLRAVVPLALGSGAVEWGSRRRNVYVVGTTAAYAPVRELEVARGGFLPAGDPRAGGAVVVLGSTLARELFAGADPLGKVVRIAEARFRVIGVLAPRGQALGFDFDDLVMVPVSRHLRLYHRAALEHVLVQSTDPSAIGTVIARVRAVLIDRHREEDFTVITQDAMLRSFRAIIDALTAGLAGIAAISLAVAGIGILNVMLVSVSERISEVGLLKALGAERADISRIFLGEALLLAALGAAVGVLFGATSITIAAATWRMLPLANRPIWIAIVVTLALVTGGVFGLLPARRAARLPAVDALRGRR